MNKEMRKVVLISCSKSKRSYPCEARKMYEPSELFRESLTYAEKISKDIYILSSKYGLLHVDKIIEPYDETLKDKSTQEKDIWAKHVVRQIQAQYDIRDVEFTILAGKDYYSPLLKYLSRENVELPLIGMRMDRRLTELRRLTSIEKQKQTLCYSLHKLFNEAQRFYWDTIDEVPFNDGIYIIFQSNEKYHGLDRIVRVGTHRGSGRLKGRLMDHFINEDKNWSIFRKNIGRAYLNRYYNFYLQIWNRDTRKANVLREIESSYDPGFQKKVEDKISKFLREHFSYTCFPVTSVVERHRLEEGIIATCHSTPDFSPSSKWFGIYSPEFEIRQSGMWLKEGLDGIALSESEFSKIERYCTDLVAPLDKSNQQESNHSRIAALLSNPIKTENGTHSELLWSKIINSLSQSSHELQTIRQSGTKGKWFSASAVGDVIEIRQAIHNKPSTAITLPRLINKNEFVSIYPNYYPWRKGIMSRVEASGSSQNSSYIFALINEFDYLEEKT